MSLRRHILRAVGLLTAVAMVFGAFAGSAVAKKVSHKQKVRAQLLRAVKKNPRVVLRKSFLHKAALVNFKLPVTVRLRGSNNTTPLSPVYDKVNPNSATVNLGGSLGNRQVNLGGTLPAEVEFNDQFDGGALGNVRINILPGGTGSLKTTSIPLLWNANVSTAGATHPWWGIGFDPTGEKNDGCGGFVGSANLATPFTTGYPAIDGNGAGYYSLGTSQSGNPYTGGIPYFTATANPVAVDPRDPYGILGNALAFEDAVPSGGAAATPYYYDTVPEIPGVDGLTQLKASGETTGYTFVLPGPTFASINPPVVNNVGLNPDPFPVSLSTGVYNSDNTSWTSQFDPGGTGGGLATDGQPNVQDTVLRTAPISLTVAPAGTSVVATDDTLGVDGSQNIVIGKSGGQANLFGNIPGKSYGIDVTVSLQGKINSILRAVDTDNSGLIAGRKFPPAAFECRQAFTGSVQNYFPGVRLKGNLQISPAITKDGLLRIAKAQLSSLEPTDIAVAACLMPATLFAAQANNSDSTVVTVPNLPINETAVHPVPGNKCKDRNTPVSAVPGDASATVLAAGIAFDNLTNLAAASTGYTTNADGSRVSVAAQLNVDNVAADVIIGRNEAGLVGSNGG